MLWGSGGAGEWPCEGVAVWGTCGVGVLQCRGVALSVWELQCMGVAVVTKP